MKITKAYISAFRNLRELSFMPSPDINVICGANGQGKTNLLEAMWLLTGSKSFLNAKEGDFIPFDGDFARCDFEFFAFQREQSISYTLGRKKEALLNGVKKNSLSSLCGNFAAVIFSPAHLLCIKGSSSERRALLDLVIGELKPRYLVLLSRYKKILNQRNSLLKDVREGIFPKDLLDEWDENLSKASCLISKTRKTYCDRLFPIAQSFYEGISTNKERLVLKFAESGSESFDEKEFLKLLHKERKKDISCGFTGMGCHRDDIKLFINDRPLADFGSQGQIRSSVLSLKLAEAQLIKELLNEQPVIFLDDVLSELDEERQSFLLKSLKERQIFLTCCDFKQVREAEMIIRIKDGQIF